MIRTLIVDDEPLSCSKLRRFLQSDPEIELIGECGSGKQAVEAIRNLQPDLVFLDVQMPEMNGFQVLQSLEGIKLPVIVFVTAYDHYALQAFEFYPVDYLLKPFARARFEKTLQQAKNQIAGGVKLELTELIRKAQHKPKFLERLMIQSPGRIFFIKVSDIEWIEADGRHCKIYAAEESHLLKSSLVTLETQLDPHRFFRINRSSLVNLDHIREFQMFHGDYIVILKSGKSLTLSHRYLDRVEELFSHR